MIFRAAFTIVLERRLVIWELNFSPRLSGSILLILMFVISCAHVVVSEGKRVLNSITNSFPFLLMALRLLRSLPVRRKLTNLGPSATSICQIGFHLKLAIHRQNLFGTNLALWEYSSKTVLYGLFLLRQGHDNGFLSCRPLSWH